MRLVYIYHSGFVVEAEGFSILIDYFKDTNPDPAKGFVRGELLKRPGTLYVLASHFHPDHFNPDERGERRYQIYFLQGYLETPLGKSRGRFLYEEGRCVPR